MWSGISRSGATIMGGMALGLTPRVATLFSFYLAIPTMLAASVKTLWKYRNDLSSDGAGIVLLGSGVSFVVALAVVALFLRFVRTQRFTVFVVYRILLGVIVIGWYLATRPTGP
jgi:undecaprenyl-diphosphatase